MAVDGLAIVDEPRGAARQLPDLLRAARVLVRAARPRTHHDAIRRARRRALGATARRPPWGPVLWNRPVDHRGGRGARRRDRGQVVGAVRARRGSASTSSSPMRSPAGGRACCSGRRMPPSARASPRSCCSCPSPSSSTWRPGPAGSSPTAATTGTPPTTRPRPASGRGCRCRCRACGCTTSRCTTPRRITLRAQLREPRVAVAAAAAADRRCTTIDAARRGRLRGRRTAARGDREHPEPAHLVRRRRRGALPRVPVRRAPRLALRARPHRRRRDLRAVAALPRAHDLPVLHDRRSCRSCCSRSPSRCATSRGPRTPTVPPADRAAARAGCSSASRSPCRRSGTRSSRRRRCRTTSGRRTTGCGAGSERQTVSSAGSVTGRRQAKSRQS